MGYTPVGPFVNDAAPKLNAANLNQLEAGVVEAHRANVRTISVSGALVLGDASGIVECSAALTLTVPPNSTVALPIGTVIGLCATGSGVVTVAAGAGVTVNSRGALLNLAGQWAEAYLRKRGTDTWVLVGDLA